MTPMNNRKLTKIVNAYLRQKGLPVNEGVTFSDVFIIDNTSRIDRRSDIRDLKTRLGRDLYLNIPVVSANMVDVTESLMAITLARLGGVGVIHQFLPIEERCEEVHRVKRADNEIIDEPWIINENESLSTAVAFMKAKQISGLLVVDSEGRLVGILTERDIRFINHPALKSILPAEPKVRDLMTANPETAGSNITVDDAIQVFHKKKIEKLPLVDSDGRPVGLITAKDILKRWQFPDAVRDENGRLVVGAAVGISGKPTEEAEKLVEAGIDFVVVDTARGNALWPARVVKEIRQMFGELVIVAGNVDNAEGAALLFESGADCVKVGIGPGSACKTRTETGVGAPQLTAIAETAAVAKIYGGTIMADGGIRDGSHLAKALAAGASTVMLGGLLSATEEAPGELINDSGELFKVYRGSAGIDIQIERLNLGGLERIRAPEGVTRRVPYKGQRVRDVILALVENLRSSMSYANASNLEEFREKTVFRRQSRSGYEEGKPQLK